MKHTFNPKYKDNPLLKKSFEFSLMIIKFCDQLEGDRKYVLAKQILRSGTSIGANSKEAQNAESDKDFIHKLKIALKETDETEYWLYLCKEAYKYKEIDQLIQILEELSRLLNSIISTKRKNMMR